MHDVRLYLLHVSLSLLTTLSLRSPHFPKRLILQLIGWASQNYRKILPQGLIKKSKGSVFGGLACNLRIKQSQILMDFISKLLSLCILHLSQTIFNSGRRLVIPQVMLDIKIKMEILQKQKITQYLFLNTPSFGLILQGLL